MAAPDDDDLLGQAEMEFIPDIENIDDHQQLRIPETVTLRTRTYMRHNNTNRLSRRLLSYFMICILPQSQTVFRVVFYVD